MGVRRSVEVGVSVYTTPSPFLTSSEQLLLRTATRASAACLFEGLEDAFTLNLTRRSHQPQPTEKNVRLESERQEAIGTQNTEGIPRIRLALSNIPSFGWTTAAAAICIPLFLREGLEDHSRSR